MNKEERIELLRALTAASNAFYDTLKAHGYTVSYGLDNSKIGSIRKVDVPAHMSWSLGDLSITWKIKDSTSV